MDDGQVIVRPVREADVRSWAHLTVATMDIPGVDDEAEYAARFVVEPEDRRNTAFLVWWGTGPASERAVGRLRMKVVGERATAWALGLLPEVEDGGLDGAVAGALWDLARRMGAESLTAEVGADLKGRFERAGFRCRRVRVVMEADLVARPAPCERPMRHPRSEDPQEIDAMARLMQVGYRGMIDDSGETLGEALGELREMLRGDYGPFLGDCSFQIDAQGGLAGGAWVTQESPEAVLLAEVMVHPDYRGRGYGRALIQAAINACLAQGYTMMRLMVTRGNVPAEGLYRRMGFREVEGTDEVHMERILRERVR